MPKYETGVQGCAWLCEAMQGCVRLCKAVQSYAWLCISGLGLMGGSSTTPHPNKDLALPACKPGKPNPSVIFPPLLLPFS